MLIGTISEFECVCGFSAIPGSFIQEGGKFMCPICGKVVTTVNNIVQEVLKLDDRNKKEESGR